MTRDITCLQSAAACYCRLLISKTPLPNVQVEFLSGLFTRLHRKDHALLDSAARFSGCGICVALLMGRRLVVL